MLIVNINNSLTIVNDIHARGETLEDRRIVERVLRSIPKKFDLVTITIEKSRDLTKLTLVDLFGSIQVHEDRLKKNHGTFGSSFPNQFEGSR